MDDEEIKDALMANNTKSLKAVPNNYKFSDGTGLIHWASMYNNLDMCRRMMECRGAANSVGGVLDSSPLYYALYNSNYKVMKFLIENGADIRYVNKSGLGLLHTCVRFDDVLGMILLLSYGADVNTKDTKNRTLWTYAKVKGARNVQRFLETNVVPGRYNEWGLEGFSIGMHGMSFFFGRTYQIGVIVMFLVFWGRIARTRAPMYLNLFYSFYIGCNVIEESCEHSVYALEYFFTLFRLFLSDPRFGSVSTYDKVKELVSTMIEQDEYMVENFCYTCLGRKGDGVKHCSICNRCVLEFDHHCPCINSCISKDIMGLFRRHLLSTFTVTVNVLLSGHASEVRMELVSVTVFIVLILAAGMDIRRPKPI
ncbi:ankyrin repeat-containing protein [Encephalitozoon romaleae SJ-2008]|uniref:Palmitoyltransferase n=1 Tax=Encephalitozoon romaleae (strain SJ-2008) TaxID=1178016 RepID=I7AGH9_ENCRO|nr:ankyrin repeat-containing protein [Encephalitozoon romaleae SJ-2008]AFN83875.1 ankyrin repeat-containing protein [Encephalitozoon romaleae SJ-2008]